jgi:hypothetical protein
VDNPNGRKRLPAVRLKELNVSNFNLAFLSWSLFMTPGKNRPETEWICWLPFPRLATFLLPQM